MLNLACCIKISEDRPLFIPLYIEANSPDALDEINDYLRKVCAITQPDPVTQICIQNQP